MIVEQPQGSSIESESETSSDSRATNQQEIEEKEMSQDTCPVCIDAFEDPVELNCGHRYCKLCIKTYYTEQRNQPPEVSIDLSRVVHWDSDDDFFYEEIDGDLVMNLDVQSLVVEKKEKPKCAICRSTITKWKKISKPQAQPEEEPPLSPEPGPSKPLATQDLNAPVSPRRSPIAGPSREVQALRVSAHEGRGCHIKYKLEWSDGSSSWHPKTYLVSNYPDLLDKHQHETRAKNTAKWRANK